MYLIPSDRFKYAYLSLTHLTLFVAPHLQQVPVVDLHAAAGALVLGGRRRAEAGGLRRTGLPGLLLHLRLRLRRKTRV